MISDFLLSLVQEGIAFGVGVVVGRVAALLISNNRV
jgi:hypothetical protein